MLIGIATFMLAASGVQAAFELASPQRAAVVLVPASEPECVRLAAEDLLSDVRKITGRTLTLVRQVGELGDGGVVLVSVNQPESLALLERIAPGFGAGMKGQWESYRVETVGNRLIIAGSDERGTMFGLYAFIEQNLGVDPLYFWSSREPRPRATLAWAEVKFRSGPPTFRFRGWFINDEDLLTEWKESAGPRHIDYPYYAQVVPREVVRPIAEALVRSRCNLIIPASFVDILNPPEAALIEECARRGVFVSQHHVEPMGVSAFAYFNYWKKRGRDLKYSYFSHPDEVREVWRVYAEKWARFPNVVWQLGLRGIADRPMWMADPKTPQSDADRGRLISEAMAEQVRILDDVVPRSPRFQSTTLWAEGSTLNQQKLLTIPRDTIVVFADNSPGWKWQPDFFTTPRSPANTYGVYYHHALWGCGPHLVQIVSPAKTFECLQAAVTHGAGDYVICNISNVREFVLGIDATAKLAWQINGYDPDAWLSRWVAERFSRRQQDVLNAYQIYFNAWQIHDAQQVPFLMDGQMIGGGNAALGQIAKKLADPKSRVGPAVEKNRQASVRPGGAAAAGEVAAAKPADAFYKGLSDMHPPSPGRREVIRRLAQQRAGFELVLLHARTLAAELPGPEAAFLQDNLIHQSALAHEFCRWLEQIELAHEALDLGNLPACVERLRVAEAAMAGIPAISEAYTRGRWENWYRGTKKINLAATLKRTRDVRQQAESRVTR